MHRFPLILALVSVVLIGCSKPEPVPPEENLKERGSPLGEEIDQTEELRKRFEKR